MMIELYSCPDSPGNSPLFKLGHKEEAAAHGNRHFNHSNNEEHKDDIQISTEISSGNDSKTPIDLQWGSVHPRFNMSNKHKSEASEG